MKIILLHYTAPPIVGGVESVMHAHARLMADAGHEVRIIAGRGQQLDPDVGVTVLPLLDSRNAEVLAMRADLNAGRVPSNFAKLSDRIEQQLSPELAQADRVIAHNVCSLNKNLALTAAVSRLSDSERRSRFVLWHHDLAWTTPRYIPELHDGYPWNLLRQPWHQARQVVVSEWRRDELAQLHGVQPEIIRVIPNGLAAESFFGLGPHSRALVKKFDLLMAAPLILLPARITPRKNIGAALRILGALRLVFPHARLVVTGPLGPHSQDNAEYMDALLRLRRELGLEQTAVFLAETEKQAQPYEAIAELFRLADLLLLPSTEEGFGIPILEAGLSRIPVFCSDIAVLRELGGSDVNYFDPGADPNAVAGRIAEELRQNARYALQKRVLREYGWDRIYAAKIAPLLEEQ